MAAGIIDHEMRHARHAAPQRALEIHARDRHAGDRRRRRDGRRAAAERLPVEGDVLRRDARGRRRTPSDRYAVPILATLAAAFSVAYSHALHPRRVLERRAARPARRRRTSRRFWMMVPADAAGRCCACWSACCRPRRVGAVLAVAAGSVVGGRAARLHPGDLARPEPAAADERGGAGGRRRVLLLAAAALPPARARPPAARRQGSVRCAARRACSRAARWSRPPSPTTACSGSSACARARPGRRRLPIAGARRPTAGAAQTPGCRAATPVRCCCGCWASPASPAPSSGTASASSRCCSSALTGLVVSLVFALLSAPDLALTQLLVEVASVLLVMLALYFLPARSPPSPASCAALARRGAGGLAGLGVAALAYAVLQRSPDARSRRGSSPTRCRAPAARTRST